LLARNGRTVVATRDEKYATFLALADGTLAESGLAAWIRDHLAPV
jgi:prophage maintenance system killer protein